MRMGLLLPYKLDVLIFCPGSPGYSLKTASLDDGEGATLKKVLIAECLKGFEENEQKDNERSRIDEASDKDAPERNPRRSD